MTGRRPDMARILPPRVVATAGATQLIDILTLVFGPLVFFQPGACAEDGAPMCYPASEFSVGPSDVCLGVLHGSPVYIGREQFDHWQHTQLIVDVAEGQVGMFSLENGTGKRFFTRSRAFSDEECEQLARQAARDCVRN